MAHIQDRWERTVDGKRVRTGRDGKGMRWQARYRDPDGHERTRDFARKADAERFVSTIAADVLRGAFVDPNAGKVTFAGFAERWREAQTFTESTREVTKLRLRLHAVSHSVSGSCATSSRRSSKRGCADSSMISRRRMCGRSSPTPPPCSPPRSTTGSSPRTRARPAPFDSRLASRRTCSPGPSSRSRPSSTPCLIGTEQPQSSPPDVGCARARCSGCGHATSTSSASRSTSNNR